MAKYEDLRFIEGLYFIKINFHGVNLLWDVQKRCFRTQGQLERNRKYGNKRSWKFLNVRNNFGNYFTEILLTVIDLLHIYN